MLSCTTINKLMLAASTQHSKATSSGGGSETQSEISSAESDWSDIRAIALKLGVPNPDDLHTERFKVDRHKLENMIKAESAISGMNGAQYFFENVMRTTETYISWPCRLKIGAKSKKDPHVRIVGKSEEVHRAKERILANLDSRGTRVIMKMDVSYTDHSFIIGRGGNNIKRIMEETSTHIHFPDSNRSNPSEKSNQVSLCGSLEGVERARALVRLSTPLLISFELPILAPGRVQPDHETPYIKMVEAKFNVQVIFSSRPKLHSALVLVKGSEKEAVRVQEATLHLIEFTCEGIAGQMLVNMQLEISPQHHEIVKGSDNSNLLSIMERTKTKIIFPDLSDINVKPIKKSQVTITGTIDGVYKARQQLLGNLPIALIFDFPDNQNDAFEIMALSTKYGVFISLRQKQRQSTLAIVIKGVEKFIDKIYEARHEILRLNTPLIKPAVPETYFSPKDNELGQSYRTTLTSLLAGYPDSPKTPKLGGTSGVLPSQYGNLSNGGNNNNSNMPNQNMNNNNMNMPNFNNSNNGSNTNINNNGQYSKYSTTPTSICVPTQKYMQIHNSNNSNNINNNPKFQRTLTNHTNNYLQAMPTHGLAAPLIPPMMQQQHQHQQQQQHLVQQEQPQHQQHQQQHKQQQPPPPPVLQVQPPRSSLSPRNSCSNTSGYQSFSSSTNSLEQAYPSYGSAGSAGLGGPAGGIAAGGGSGGGSAPPGLGIVPNLRTHYSPDTMYSSEAGCSRIGRRSSDGVLLELGNSGQSLGGHLMSGGPGSAESYRNLHFDMKHNRSFDFDMKRAMGFKAMERPPISGELRTPNANWMGLALSRTSPVPMDVAVDDFSSPWNRQGGAASAGPMSPYGLGITTGVVDSTPTNRRLNLSQHKDIHSLLTCLGLEHYIKTFVLNEIDLEMFVTLTEDNLMELGITAFGARKKILVAIHTLLANEASCSQMPSTSTSNTSSPRFSGSAAPGAERRPSSQW